jgi:hypothetical protein
VASPKTVCRSQKSKVQSRSYKKAGHTAKFLQQREHNVLNPKKYPHAALYMAIPSTKGISSPSAEIRADFDIAGCQIPTTSGKLRPQSARIMARGSPL